MTGFEVTFVPIGEFSDYPIQSHFFGSTTQVNYVEPMNVVSSISYDVARGHIDLIYDTLQYQNGGLMQWFIYTTGYKNIFAVPPPDFTGFYNTWDSSQLEVDTRIIGFKASLGLSSTGLETIIRDLEFIVDTDNCELARWVNSILTDPLRYLYLSEQAATVWVSAGGPATEFWVRCPYSVSLYTATSGFTFSNITVDGFTVSYQDDSIP